ncbi:MAG: hypothetical protein U1D06_10165, partial [Paracoccaceae bacterium]|nr:hypothetical protein [Paracoccaceae bacterium]
MRKLSCPPSVRVLFLTLLAFYSLLPLPAAAFLHSGAAETKTGRDLYVQQCAACHGTNLEGQPDWRSPDETGL